MLFDRRGQGYVEYVVLVGAGMIVAGIVMQMFQAIGGVFQRATERIETIGSGF